jgi:hypothetical protein
MGQSGLTDLPDRFLVVNRLPAGRRRTPTAGFFFAPVDYRPNGPGWGVAPTCPVKESGKHIKKRARFRRASAFAFWKALRGHGEARGGAAVKPRNAAPQDG